MALALCSVKMENKLCGNFENGVQKGLETHCSGIDRLPGKKGLFYLLKN